MEWEEGGWRLDGQEASQGGEGVSEAFSRSFVRLLFYFSLFSGILDPAFHRKMVKEYR